MPRATESATGCTYGEWNSKHLCRQLSERHRYENPKFEGKTNALTFTLTPTPTFRDKFHRVQEL
eukprot:9159198-Ditylum_brightwellii.AAC.1